MSQPFHLNKNAASPPSIDPQKMLQGSKSPLQFQGKTVSQPVSLDSEDTLHLSQTGASSQKNPEKEKFSLFQAGKKFL
ncbi:MAG: hypothetical protein K2X66_14295, partial [Cyanobacteria bacterium]|nr:hypothetical protein [Cyanobacteriota bacterium]